MNPANANLQYSGSGLKLTESFEGYRLTPYQDIRGVWTNGYGNTHGVVPGGPPITQLQAEQDLLNNVQWAANTVRALVTIALTQGEFDALVDFVFNVGSGNFASSTLLKDLNANNLAAAADEFPKWDLAAGQVVAGLLRRRMAEQAEFTSGETS